MALLSHIHAHSISSIKYGNSVKHFSSFYFIEFFFSYDEFFVHLLFSIIFPPSHCYFHLIWLQCDRIWLRSKRLLGDVGRNNWRNVSIFSTWNKRRAQDKRVELHSISFKVLFFVFFYSLLYSDPVYNASNENIVWCHVCFFSATGVQAACCC